MGIETDFPSVSVVLPSPYNAANSRMGIETNLRQDPQDIIALLTMQLIPGWELKRNDRGDGRRDSIPYNAANSRMGIET